MFYSYIEPEYCRLKKENEETIYSNKNNLNNSNNGGVLEKSDSNNYTGENNFYKGLIYNENVEYKINQVSESSPIINNEELLKNNSDINFYINNINVLPYKNFNQTKFSENSFTITIDESYYGLYESPAALDYAFASTKVYNRRCRQDETNSPDDNYTYKVIFPICYVLTILLFCFIYKKYKKVKADFAGLKSRLELQMTNTNTSNSNSTSTNNSIRNRGIDGILEDSDNSLGLELDDVNLSRNNTRKNSNENDKKLNKYLGPIKIF